MLELAAAAGFDALITSDRAIEAEQNATTIPLAIVIMHARSNKLEDILPLIPELLKLLNHLPLRAFTHVQAP